MKLKRIIPIAVILITSLLLGAFLINEKDEPREKLILNSSYEILSSLHYSPQDLNDEFSQRVFDLYIQSLDYSKMYFTKDQIDILSTYKNSIDDQIRSGSLDFFNLSIELIDSQTKKIQEYYTKVLEQPIDYTVNETININSDKRDYCTSQSELEDYWRKYLKYQILAEMILLENEQTLKAKDCDTCTVKTESELEKIARENILKRTETRFKRITKVSRDDRFSSLINAIAGSFDPHTNYFPPTQEEDFNISIKFYLPLFASYISKNSSSSDVSIVFVSYNVDPYN